MKLKYSCRKAAAALFVLALSTPQVVGAVDLIVEQNPTDPSHFSSIQEALNHANELLTGQTPTTTSFTVIVEPGTYNGGITLVNNVPLKGRETARTIITGTGSNTLITANSINNVTIQNFTFTNALTGINVNSSAITITGNIFRTGTGSTALRLQNSPATEIINNTFYQIGTAISRDSDLRITNNIFSRNGTAILDTSLTTALVTYNTYHNNTNPGFTTDSNSIPNLVVLDTDPRFVDPAVGDFHLAAGSTSIGNGNPNYKNAFNATSDMGAYGGPDADTIPFPVSGLDSTVTSSTSNSVSLALTWNANRSYLVQGYRLHYGTASPAFNGTEASEGNSPLTIPVETTAATLSNLLSSTVTPSAPVLNKPGFFNEGLSLTWSPASGATGYKVYFSTSAFDSASLPGTFDFVAGGSATSHELSGLTNGQTYYAAVSAVAQTKYFIAVTAFNDPAGTFQPGINNESAFPDQELGIEVGTPQESTISNVVQEFPEAIANFPDLPGNGCFIATAAYGYYSAPQVQALREFRDRYLLTNTPGRAFVRWYYTVGPRAAQVILDHPWSKPIIRMSLAPLIAGALFMTQATVATKIIAILSTGFLIIYFVTNIYRRRGGVH